LGPSAALQAAAALGPAGAGLLPTSNLDLLTARADISALTNLANLGSGLGHAGLSSGLASGLGQNLANNLNSSLGGGGGLNPNNNIMSNQNKFMSKFSFGTYD